MTHRGDMRLLEPSTRKGNLTIVLAIIAAVLLLGVPTALAQDEPDPTAEAAPAALDRGQAVIGKHLFRSFCASCHGQEAKGDGSIADMLSVHPANLTLLAAENGGVFPFQRSMAVIDGREKVQGHGTAEMPAWGDAFAEISDSEEQVQQKISQLVHFIWSVQETPMAEE